MFYKYTFCLALYFLTAWPATGQTSFTGLINPQVSIMIKNPTPWSYQFGLANRSELMEGGEFGLKPRFMETSVFVSREIGENGKLTTGLRYRFNEAFRDNKNELRSSQEYEYSNSGKILTHKQRLRFAQRFRERTSYRLRYRYAVEVPVGNNLRIGQTYKAGLYAEGLWEFSGYQASKFDQRYGAYFDFPFTDNTNLGLGLEYRYRDFTNSTYQQLFFLTSLEISI